MMEFQVLADKENKQLSLTETGVKGPKSLNVCMSTEEIPLLPRTPLHDVKNRQSRIVPGQSKVNVDKNSQRLEALDLLSHGTPTKLQTKALKQRRSCFASFNPAAQTRDQSSVTLPQRVEEEPDDCQSLFSAMSLGSISSLKDSLRSSSPESDVSSETPHERPRCPTPCYGSELEQRLLCKLSDSGLEVAREVIILAEDSSTDICKAESELHKRLRLGSSELTVVTPEEDSSPDNSETDTAENSKEDTHSQVDESVMKADETVIAVVEQETDELVQEMVTECASELSQLTKSWSGNSPESPHVPDVSQGTLHIDHLYSKRSGSKSLTTAFPPISETDMNNTPDQSLCLQVTDHLYSSTPNVQEVTDAEGASFFCQSSTSANQIYSPGPGLRPPSCSPVKSDNFLKMEEEARQRLSESLCGLLNMSTCEFKAKLEAQELSSMIDAYLYTDLSGKEESTLSSPTIDKLLGKSTTNSACSPDFTLLSQSPSVGCCQEEYTRSQTLLQDSCHDHLDSESVKSPAITSDNHLSRSVEPQPQNEMNLSLSQSHGPPSLFSKGNVNTGTDQSLQVSDNDPSVSFQSVSLQALHNVEAACDVGKDEGKAEVISQKSPVNWGSSHVDISSQSSEALSKSSNRLSFHPTINSLPHKHQAAALKTNTFQAEPGGASVYGMKYQKVHELMNSFMTKVHAHRADVKPTKADSRNVEDSNSSLSPPKLVDTSVLTDPAVWKLVNCSMNTDPPLSVNKSVITDSTDYRDANTSAAFPRRLVDVSVITDSSDHRDANTSAVFPQSFVDVSVLTDHIFENLVDCSMNTEQAPNADKSVVTDMVDHINADTNTSTREYTDVSVLTEEVVRDVLDKSVLTDGALNTSKHDLSIMAVAELINKQTMTDRNQVTDAASGMTPVKLTTKQGHRFTADDIRRQHPRVVANQLDSTMSANQRLEKEVKVLTQERNRLQTSLKETRSKLQTSDRELTQLRDSHSSDIALLEQLHEEAMSGVQRCVDEKQQRVYQLELEADQANAVLRATETSLAANLRELQGMCETLEGAKQQAEMRHANEIQRLQEEFKKNSYKEQFETSMKAIAELQAEREEFVGLMDDIEGAAAMQFRLRDSLHHMTRKAKEKMEEHAVLHRQMLFEQEGMRQKLASLQVDCDIAQTESRDVQEDLRNVNDILQRSNNSLIEMEKMYEAASKDLADSQSYVKRLSTELAENTNALDQLLEAREVLTQQLSEQQDSEALACQALQESQDQLAEMEQLLEGKAAQLAASTSEKEKLKTSYEEVISKMELYIQNLQHTLDSWEVDRENSDKEIDKLYEKIAFGQAYVKDLEKEVEGHRAVTATTQQEKSLLEELKNTNQFMEAEKQLYLDTITDYRQKLEEQTQLAEDRKGHLDILEVNHSHLRKFHEQLQCEKTDLEKEVTSKRTDVELSSSVMDLLVEKMASVVSAVEKKFDIDVKIALLRDKVRYGPGQSLVSSVLSRTPKSVSKGLPGPFPKQSNVEFGAPQSENGKRAADLISPHSQSFAGTSSSSRPALKSKKCLSFCDAVESERPRSTASPGGLGRSVAGYAQIRSIPTTLNSSQDMSESSFMTLCDSLLGSDESLLGKVKSIDRSFTMIVKAMNLAERKSELTIKDLREDMAGLHKKLRFTESEKQKKSEQLSEATARIKDLNSQTTRLSNSILEYEDQSDHIFMLEEEKADLNRQLEASQLEKSMLSSQLEDVIAKLDSTNDHKPDGACLREIVALKKQINELQMTLADERKRSKDLGQKAVNRLKIFENNWQKAEADVSRFDDLVENIRAVCIKHQSRNTHPALLDIVRWIDGRQPSLPRSRDSLLLGSAKKL